MSLDIQPMNLLENLIPRARDADRALIFPEGQDPRVMQAAARLAGEGIARTIVLADDEECRHSLNGVHGNSSLTIINHRTSKHKESLAAAFHRLRRNKGLTPEEAADKLNDRLYFANMMVREGLADGLIAGSIASTPDVLRASFQCIGTSKGTRIASSSFLMELAKPSPAGNETLLFADCAVNPQPCAEELVDIALSTAATCRALLQQQPRVAFLSFSTHGSTRHPLTEKIRQATEMTLQRVRDEKMDIIVDGEIQADAALVPAVAQHKCKHSPLQGKANVLIFPDLQAGNICYKLVERLAGANAFGPVLQGLAKPVNDLSRGCSADDIFGVAVITACQAIDNQGMESNNERI